MTEFEIFQDLISKSIKKNGKDYVLTLDHLKNLLNMTSRIAAKQREEHERAMDEALQNALSDDNYGDR